MIDINELLRRINSVLPKHSNESIALHEPRFSAREIECVESCIKSGWVSSNGSFIDEFENELSRFTGIKNVIAVVNGTAALHLCLLASGVKEGDEVITPTLTFVATANAVKYCQAIPLFADCEELTLSIDPTKIEEFLKKHAQIKGQHCYNKNSGNRISALIAMHVYGHPGKIDVLAEICKAWNITLIEDAAESLGSFYKGHHTGSFGRVSAVSFNGNKIITTGGGGAILTNDDIAAKRIRHLSTTAKIASTGSFIHDEVGFNYRMPNLNAALGCAQLEQLPNFLLKKRGLSQKYFSALEGFEGLKLIAEPPHAQSNFWLNTIILDEKFENQIEDILCGLEKNGIQARPCWTLMHKLKIYEKIRKRIGNFLIQFYNHQSIRKYILIFRFNYFKWTRGIALYAGDEGKNLRPKLISHNLTAFENPMGDFTIRRMRMLLGALTSIETLGPSSKILIIGPRTESDIFILRGLGFENIAAIDLISYSPLINLGDMHHIPYADNSFDAVICGWTISYSANPKLAANEMYRVLNNNGLIAIGLEHVNYQKMAHAQEDSRMVDLQPEKDRINTIDDIKELFNTFCKYEVIFNHDALMKDFDPNEAQKISGMAGSQVMFIAKFLK